ncbi:ABC transporter ATP-binding protein [Clostridium butyricum]|uniref:ABC transporter ATP-binding protein n=1 Tax=Clostridium butyricum TaxID=1492 RepID=UPI00374FA473
MSDIAIKIENLSKVYKLYDKPIDRMKESLSLTKKKYGRDHYALKDISFEVKKGETVGILGTNGSGKSTLLKIITGVLTPSSGKVEVNGKISALLELGAGFNPEYTGLENIYLNGTMMGYTREQMEERVQPIMDFADIGEFIHQPVKTYSSGMFARLAFAVAINVEPEILIVDEALSVGDVKFQIKCMDKMKEMMEGGTTVLFVSHDTNAIRRFCAKAIWLNNGLTMDIGEVNKIADKYLDFLKCKDISNTNIIFTENENDNIVEKDRYEKKINDSELENIAEIIDFRLLNENNEEVSIIRYDEYLKVRISYNVYDESIRDVVLGVALNNINDESVCGLNTLLDKVNIPWVKGKNYFELEYSNGVRVLGGNYFFDVALFESTATVPIQYIQRIKKINVYAEYVGQGIYIIQHKWRECSE